MANASRGIALKPYLEAVEEHCSKLSKAELVQLVMSMAKEESTFERELFLDKLETFMPGKKGVKTALPDIEGLLEDVQALKESIMERIETIENGDYDALDDWDWKDVDYDDEPEMISDEQLDVMEGLFHIAGSMFLNGDLLDSRQLYEALFGLLKELVESDYVMPEPNIEIREERARYARCVWETSDGRSRLKEFADAMDIEPSFPFNIQKVDDNYPLLQDVMDAREQGIKGIQDFFPRWKKLLEKKGTGGRKASLLVEVVYFTSGLTGVEKLARKWGSTQPYGYLYWLDRLRQEKRWEEIIKTAKEALKLLKTGQAREKISDYLTEAGRRAGDTTIVLEGWLEKFYSHPCDANLKALLTEAIKQQQREESLAQVLDFYSRQKELSSIDESLYVKALLLTGDLENAWKIVKSDKDLGWSSHMSTGLVFGCICTMAADFNENAGTIRKLVTFYCENAYYHSAGTNDQADFFRDEIITGLSQNRLKPSGLEPFTEWAFMIGRNRVDGIVSNTHRSAYDRAAWVLVSLAEVYAARGEAQKAKSLFTEYCKVKYNRHSAFKREVKQVISESTLLRQSGNWI